MTCNVMVSYFKINHKVQRNERQSRSERADSSRSEQENQSMSGEIRVEQIRDGESILDQTELIRMIRLDQSGVKASGEKRGRSEQSNNVTEREKSRAKREKKSVARRSERIVRKLMWSRSDK